MKKRMEEMTGLKNRIQLNIQEIKQPELGAALIAQGSATSWSAGWRSAGP